MSDLHRVAAEVLGMPWEKCRNRLGRHLEAPAVDLRVGRQPDDSCDDPRGARGGQDAKKKLQEIAAKTLGGSPESTRSPTSACSAAAAGMTLAQAAQKAIELGGKYDGHELPKTSTQ